MQEKFKEMQEKLLSGFFGFWIKKYKVSFLLIFLILFSGGFSLWIIPKESSPDIKIGIISIVTPYIGVNPEDIDNLITEKIEKEVKDIEGVKKMTSSSSVGISSIVLQLDDGIEGSDVISEVRTAVDKVKLPSEAEETIVAEISTMNELMFQVYLYGKKDEFDYFTLMQKARKIQSELEGKGGIKSINIGEINPNAMDGGGGNSGEEYEIKVLVDKSKMEILGLSLNNISSVISAYNKNTPLGNYTIGELNYDFRIYGELSSIEDLKKLIIRNNNGSTIRLGDISDIKREYKSGNISRLGGYNDYGYNYISLVFNKETGGNVFKIADNAKELLEEELKEDYFKGLEIKYVYDMSELIREDYKNLSITAIQTLVLVFITILIFVGFRASIIATLLLPMSFLVTFTVLDQLELSLNFLTNFSLVLTLGIAIDTIIVIIEGASERLHMGYSPRNAILIAVKDFKAPLIAGTMTTLVAFLPLMFLPGVMGKFLSYIPITVFSTLLAALIISLTVSTPIFMKLSKNQKTYIRDEKTEESMRPEEKEFLEFERIGKTEKKHEEAPLREKTLIGLGNLYYGFLKLFIRSRLLRIIVIITPIIAMVFTFIVLAPKIGFILFPASDNSQINISIEAKTGTDKESLVKYLDYIDEKVSIYPELKVYSANISGSNINIYIELIDKLIRQEKGMRTVFEVEKLISDELSKLEPEGLEIAVSVAKEGPPTGSPVGIKLTADSNDKISILKEVSTDFEEYLKTFEGTKNISNSSVNSPGVFDFVFDRDKLSSLSLTPNDLIGEIYSITNGLKAGTIKSKYEDNDIVIKFSQFDDTLTPENITDLKINTKTGKINLGEFINYNLNTSVSNISREDGKITISVNSELLDGILPTNIQPKLIEFADNYEFPEGISYISGGESAENSELIISTGASFLIALFLIFSILVFQFNSYIMPAMIIYSVVLAFLGVNIGLYITGNPYSMTFAIGFIALTGVVVNDAIILIDRINRNLEKGVDNEHAVLQAGKSRLQPIIVTTLTTVFGVLPLALQDEFWAGLGFTIIFGLLAGSTMTLFVIPSLYYEVFLRKGKRRIG